MNSGPTISLGSTGDDVKRIQRLFVVSKVLPYTAIDGVFGPETQSAVESFQSGAGLTVDGIVGPATWAALPPDPNTPLLAAGSSGAAVTALQQGLLRYGGSGSATDPGSIDGVFGPLTAAAVRAYQTQRVLPEGGSVDGIVGDVTWFVPVGAAGATLASLSGLA
jgi:peptidoglycan hydrolase-like protein with peptidoglycan-binding domain